MHHELNGNAPSPSLTKTAPRFKDVLDVVKFICKDYWTAMFGKQIDNLRTNHKVSMHFDQPQAWLAV